MSFILWFVFQCIVLSAFLCLYVGTFLLLIERQQIYYCLPFALVFENIGLYYYLFQLFVESLDNFCDMSSNPRFLAVNIPCVLFLEYCIDYRACIFKIISTFSLFYFLFYNLLILRTTSFLFSPPPNTVLLFSPGFSTYF